MEVDAFARPPAVVAVAAVAVASVSVVVPDAADVEAPGSAAQPAGGQRVPELLGAAAVAGAHGLRPLNCVAQKPVNPDLV
jgi:hypothetical protein